MEKKYLINKKNVIIFSLLILVIILILIILFLLLNNKNISNIDASNMSYSELLQMFEEEGYKFELTSLDDILYITLKNSSDGITIQRIPNTLVGTLMTFYDNTINGEIADLIDTSKNDTKGKENQYKAFKNWLNYYNLSEMQLCTMLDKYYQTNFDKIEYIDTNKILNNNN